MRNGISALCFVALTGCTAAEAPAPIPATDPMPATVEARPATSGTRFDGTYAFVSKIKLNDTYLNTLTLRVRPCGELPMGPLTIVNGRARFHGYGYWNAAGFEGTVGPQGELAMRSVPQPYFNTPVEKSVLGRIDGNGTVSARYSTQYCSYELIWQKQSN